MLPDATSLSRRTFLGTTAGLAAASLTSGRLLAAGEGKPDSKFNGVQIGVITYSYRSLPSTAEDILKYVLQCGISSIELMGPPAEKFAQAYAATGQKTDDPMAGFKALRKMYNDAGVDIHIAKFGNIGDPKMSDEQIDYYIQAAKALGARGITRELNEAAAERLGPIGDKQDMLIGFHNHTQLRPDTYDGPVLSYGKCLRINFDIGHYVAANNVSPIPLIEKHHDRIISLHLKDRKKDNGPNQPFGEGDTGVAEVLQYLRQNKLTFPGDVELEYKVPEGSDAVQEVIKCVQFCKAALS